MFLNMLFQTQCGPSWRGMSHFYNTFPYLPISSSSNNINFRFPSGRLGKDKNQYGWRKRDGGWLCDPYISVRIAKVWRPSLSSGIIHGFFEAGKDHVVHAVWFSVKHYQKITIILQFLLDTHSFCLVFWNSGFTQRLKMKGSLPFPR